MLGRDKSFRSYQRMAFKFASATHAERIAPRITYRTLLRRLRPAKQRVCSINIDSCAARIASRPTKVFFEIFRQPEATVAHARRNSVPSKKARNSADRY